ncbi:MAG: hypothetical protein AAF333_09950 [Planctomycetota bacterium]
MSDDKRSFWVKWAGVLSVVAISVTTSGQGVGWDDDDYLVGLGRGNGAIAVYDHDFSLKGVLDYGTNPADVGSPFLDGQTPRGMTFDPAGRLVAAFTPVSEISVNAGLSSIRVYDPTGMRTPDGLASTPFDVLGGFGFDDLPLGIVARPGEDYYAGSTVGVITTKPHPAAYCADDPTDNPIRPCILDPPNPFPSFQAVQGLALISDDVL